MWACLELSLPLRGTNSKTTHYLLSHLSSSIPSKVQRYCKSCGYGSEDHDEYPLRSAVTTFLIPKRYDQHPRSSVLNGSSQYADVDLKINQSELLVKVKCAYELIVAHQAGAYTGFCSMKRPGVFLLPPGWDASSSQGYSQH